MKQSRSNWKLKVVLGCAVLGISAMAIGIQQITAQATLAKVFVGNSRYSFVGKLTSGNTTTSSIALIDTTQDMENFVFSTTSQQLQSGDLLRIGSNYYYVATGSAVLQHNQVALDRPLADEDTADGTAINYQAIGDLSIALKTTANNPNGSFRVLVPAMDATINSSDGQADAKYFDFNLDASVVCPGNVTGFTFADGVASPSATSITVNSNSYHTFTCSFTGDGPEATDFGYDSGNSSSDYIVIRGLLNPAPDLDHIPGEVNLNTILVQELNSAGAVIKTNYVDAGYVDAVKAVVNVAPQITFEVQGIAADETHCDGEVTTTIATTGYEVPFGDISPAMFSEAAQTLSVTTNAANGYAITVSENDQLSLEGLGCHNTGSGEGSMDCINDFGDLETATAWSDPAVNGFGYTLGTASGPTYTDAAGNDHVVASAFTFADGYKKFADQAESEIPQLIMSNTSSTNGDSMDFCYRITPSANILPGYYENSVIFTATATF